MKLKHGFVEEPKTQRKQRSDPPQYPYVRRLAVGAEVLPGGGTHFRVWAPMSRSVAVELSPASAANHASVVRLESEERGYWSGYIADAAPGMLYRFRLDEGSFPDPASRFQPDGPHGASQIVDPARFQWTDGQWGGVPRRGQVVYEMHIGTFTPEGTWAAAAEQLPELARLGITVLELMPVAEFPGRFGWGYDGVDLFAPTRLYGAPDDLRAFVDRAHAAGLGVILDVVYNHIGPDGNYLKHFSEHYFSQRYVCEWGQAINFDDEHSGPVREFVLANAAYWIEEFHLDGLRVDATQQIFDASPNHILGALSRKVREAGRGRETYIVAENEPQHTRLVRPFEQGGFGMDALWNDDFHHTAIAALTGHDEAYYSDYKGTPQEFISAMKYGYLYQGQWYTWQKKRRGSPSFGLEPAQFINFIQNHDQVANSLRGLRIRQLTDPARFRALTALLLLGPGTPMLFQGQEFGASTPFLYFADHNPTLARQVAKGRKDFLSQFETMSCPGTDAYLAEPASEETFRRSKLDWSEREKHADIYALHRQLLRLRKEDPVFSRPRPGGVDGAVLGPEAFVLRFFGKDQGDRLLLVNLGLDLRLGPAPEPLLAPVPGSHWTVKWSSEDPCFGGCGAPPLEREEIWKLPGHSALVLVPEWTESSDEST